MIKLLLLPILLLSLIACEKVIDVDLNSADPQTVVEAVITAEDSTHLIFLTQSGSFTDAEGLGVLTGAAASITNDLGMAATFTEIGDGLYQVENYPLMANRTYDLSITNGEEVITASSTLGKRVLIDSIYVDESPFQGGGQGGDGEDTTRYQVHVMFSDPVDEENFYRIRLYRLNKDEWSAEVGEDELYNGEDVDLLFFGSGVQEGDTIAVELWSMDRAGYDYYRTLANIQESNPFTSATPYNPISNLSGGLGHFTVYQRDQWIGIVEP